MITKREGTYFSAGAMLKFIDIDLDKKHVDAFQEVLRKSKMLEVDECNARIFEEFTFDDTVSLLDEVLTNGNEYIETIHVTSISMYIEIYSLFEQEYARNDAHVNTKYKTVEKKVKPVEVPLPKSSDMLRKDVCREPMLREPGKIGYVKSWMGDFLLEEYKDQFKRMLQRHGKAFAFSPHEIGCVDPSIIEPMVIFTIPHVPWNFRPIPIPRARVSQLIDLLNEKIKMGILEPSNAPYSNRWFTVEKKDGSLRFIQDLQPVNAVTIRNAGIRPIADEFAEAFAGHAIYSSVEVKETMFGMPKIMVVGHLCGPYGRKPSPKKIDALQSMENRCETQSEVRRFLGVCLFYYRWKPHYARVAKPLYQLLRKNKKFEWSSMHTNAMIQLKEMLLKAPVLRKPHYSHGRKLIVTVDSTPIGIGWALGQEDNDKKRYVIRFGAKVLNSRQMSYAQIKRQLWGYVTAIKNDKDYLIGVLVIVETDCLPMIGMIMNCSTPDVDMLRWIAYIKSLSLKFMHITNKENVVVDMLSRASYYNAKDMEITKEDVEDDFYTYLVVVCFDLQRFEKKSILGIC
mgnify:CR=1 FL=1